MRHDSQHSEWNSPETSGDAFPQSREEWEERLRDPDYPRFVRVVGKPLAVEIERNIPQRIDHVFANINAGEFGVVRLALNTLSMRNRVAGFDARVRVGIVQEKLLALPEPGVCEMDRFDYDEIEAAQSVRYIFHSKDSMEKLLLRRICDASLVEAWGDLYARRHFGLHQIHSRHTSCAVAENIVGRDGGMRLFFPEQKRSELYLFKFCGQ